MNYNKKLKPQEGTKVFLLWRIGKGIGGLSPPMRDTTLFHEFEGRGEGAFLGDVTVEEVEAKCHNRHRRHAYHTAATVDEVVEVVDKQEAESCQGVESAVHDGGHDDGTALDAHILDDDT